MLWFCLIKLYISEYPLCGFECCLKITLPRVGVFQSVVDVYVNCEKIGRQFTRSILDLFAYKKKFKPNKVEFRLAQRGYGRNVHSRYLVSSE